MKPLGSRIHSSVCTNAGRRGPAGSSVDAGTEARGARGGVRRSFVRPAISYPMCQLARTQSTPGSGMSTLGGAPSDAPSPSPGPVLEGAVGLEEDVALLGEGVAAGREGHDVRLA